MKAMGKLFGAGLIAAAVALTVNSCQKEINVEETLKEVDVPGTVSGIHVSVGAGIIDTKSAVVYASGKRTLTFTSGDKLFVSASIELDLGDGLMDYTLSGNLDAETIGSDGTTATFSGNLDLYKFSFPQPEQVSYDFGTDNPLDLCSSAQALLVHEGTTIVSGGMTGSGYFEQMASSVEELMTTCLNVFGAYDTTTHSFSLSAAGMGGQIMPIFNCSISGLAANTAYEVYLLSGTDADSASGSRALGGITANGMGEVTFACYSSVFPNTERYYAFRFKNGNDWRRAELGSKTLESKVYNITRVASEDPASPIMPTVTGTAGTWNSDLSVYYTCNTEIDVTISGTSKGYYFNFNVPGGTLRLDNLSASYHVNPFIFAYTDMYIELSGDNSIITKGQSCIESYGNIWLSCTGASATLSVTYDGYGLWGITNDDNYPHEPLTGGPGTNPDEVSNYSVPELAAPGYSVELTTVSNADGTWTTTYTVTHTGLLNGEFTINASGDKVRFSEGNLRYYSIDDSHEGNGTWSFAPYQYSMIGSNGNNTHPTSPQGGSYMDLFCWGATGIPNTGDLTNPTPTPDAPDHYYYTGTSTLSGLYEWGNVQISNTNLTNSGSEKWRTLTKDEWAYLFNNTSKYGFGLVEGCIGAILLPDGFVDPETNGGSAAFVNAPGNGYSDNVYTGYNWKAMEVAGAVFLPAAGYYTDHYENMINGCAYYWSSTPHESDDTRAYFVMMWIYDNSTSSESRISYGYFNSTDLGYNRATRLSVRLVRSN